MFNNNDNKMYNISGIVDFKIVSESGEIINTYSGHNKDTIYSKLAFNPANLYPYDISKYLQFDYVFKDLNTIFGTTPDNYAQTCWSQYDNIVTSGTITETNYANCFTLQPTPANTLTYTFRYTNSGINTISLYGLFSYISSTPKYIFTLFYLPSPYVLPSNSTLIGTYTITYEQYTPSYPTIGNGDNCEVNTINYNAFLYDVPVNKSVRNYKYSRIFQKTTQSFGVNVNDTNIASTVFSTAESTHTEGKFFDSGDAIGQLFYKFLEDGGVGNESVNGISAIRFARIICSPAVVFMINGDSLTTQKDYLYNNLTYYPLILGNLKNTKIFQIYSPSRGYSYSYTYYKKFNNPTYSNLNTYERLSSVGELDSMGTYIPSATPDTMLPVYPWKIYLNGNHAECGGVTICQATCLEPDYQNGGFKQYGGYYNWFIKPLYLYWDNNAPPTKFKINVTAGSGLNGWSTTNTFSKSEILYKTSNGLWNTLGCTVTKTQLVNAGNSSVYSDNCNVWSLNVTTNNLLPFASMDGDDGCLFVLKIFHNQTVPAINVGIESDFYGYFAFTYPWVNTEVAGYETEIDYDYIHEYLYEVNDTFYNDSMLADSNRNFFMNNTNYNQLRPDYEFRYKNLSMVGEGGTHHSIPNKNYTWISVKKHHANSIVGYLNPTTTRWCETSRDICLDGTTWSFENIKLNSWGFSFTTRFQYHWGIWNDYGESTQYNTTFPFFSMINFWAASYDYIGYWAYSDYSKKFNNFFHIKLSDSEFLLNGIYYNVATRTIKALDGVGNLHVSEGYNMRVVRQGVLDMPPRFSSALPLTWNYGTWNYTSLGMDYYVAFGKKVGTTDFKPYIFTLSTLPSTDTFKYNNPTSASWYSDNIRNDRDANLETITFKIPIDSIEQIGNLTVKFDEEDGQQSIFKTNEYISIPINDNQEELQIDALETWSSKRHSFLPENILNTVYDLSAQDMLNYTDHTSTKGFLVTTPRNYWIRS